MSTLDNLLLAELPQGGFGDDYEEVEAEMKADDADRHVELMSRVTKLWDVWQAQKSREQSIRGPGTRDEQKLDQGQDQIGQILQSVADSADYQAHNRQCKSDGRRVNHYTESEMQQIIELALDLIVHDEHSNLGKNGELVAHGLEFNSFRMLSLVYDQATDDQMRWIFTKLIKLVRTDPYADQYSEVRAALSAFCLSTSRMNAILNEDEAFALILELISVAARTLERIPAETDPYRYIVFLNSYWISQRFRALFFVASRNRLPRAYPMLITFLLALQRYVGHDRFKQYAHSVFTEASDVSRMNEVAVMISVLAVELHTEFWRSHERQDEVEDLIRWIMQLVGGLHDFKRSLAIYLVQRLVFRDNTRYGGLHACVDHVGLQIARRLSDLRGDSLMADSLITKFLEMSRDPENSKQFYWYDFN